MSAVITKRRKVTGVRSENGKKIKTFAVDRTPRSVETTVTHDVRTNENGKRVRVKRTVRKYKKLAAA